MNTRFYNPTEIRWMPWAQVGQLLPEPHLRVMVVTGESSKARGEQLREGALEDHDVRLLSGVPADPTDESVQDTLDEVRAAGPDWLIAMGGGSVLDSAKAAAMLARNEGRVLDYARNARQVVAPPIPLIAIPTTSGSGSEVTPYASMTDLGRMQKISLSHDWLYPRYALFDPEPSLTCSARQTAISGMDALSHAIEGYWSNRSTPVTDAYALVAAKLVSDVLPGAYACPSDLESRRAMLHGSLLAGLTISNARTTAVHAVSYPLTVHYHVPHGMACAMLLPSFIRYNEGAMDRRKERALLDSLEIDSMGGLADSVESLQARTEIPQRLGELGLGETDLETIVGNGFRPDRMANNPREVTMRSLRSLLESIL